MNAMMMTTGRSTGVAGRGHEPSILLAGDSEGHAAGLRRVLEGAGFEVCFAGDYSGLDQAMDARRFDVILLDVSGQHAVEAAVETALRVRRANQWQFIGYLADASLSAAGLAGDGVFPRNARELPRALRSRLALEDWGEP